MNQEQYFTDWAEREAIAEAMIPLVGRLYRDAGVEISIFGKLIVKRSVSDVLKTLRYVREMIGEELSIRDCYPVLLIIEKMKLRKAHIDIGKFAMAFKQKGNGQSLEEYLNQELAAAKSEGEVDGTEPTDVVLYGFGRIGRLLARLLIEKTGGGRSLRLRAIVVRGRGGDLEKRASLLLRDSVHGPFEGNVVVDEENDALIANGNLIKVIYADSPDSIDYTQYGISNALVVDNTGKWRDKEGLSLHLRAKGVSKVVLTAPGKGDMKNIVMGVNNGDIVSEDTILSAASCTTNAITPVLKKINDKFGIISGHVETVHSYTNDQNLIDNFHEGDRRGRSAALNMVLTETGAAKAVSKALPELHGKLTGNAIRVPTPNVSMAILNLNLENNTTKEELNNFLCDAALRSDLQKQIDYSISPEAVSSDFVGTRAAGIVDGLATIVGEKSCVVYVWYDNEFGYSCQVVRLIQQVTGSTLKAYPLTY